MVKIKPYCIYSFYTLDNKIYIGITKNFEVRIQQHKYKSCNYRLQKLLDDPNTIVFSEILYDNLSQENAIELEKKLIKQYRNDPDYEILNIQSGGLRGNNKTISKPKKLKPKKISNTFSSKVLEIRKKYAKFGRKFSIIKEARKNGVSTDYFGRILKGKRYPEAGGPLLGKDYTNG